MSGLERISLRALALAALADAPEFASAQPMSAWVQTIDARALPAYGVAALTEARTLDSLDGMSRHELTLYVVVKIKGGEDIEDDLDALCDAAEEAVHLALRTPNRDCELARSTLKIDGDGAQRVGTADLQFTVIWWEDPA